MALSYRFLSGGRGVGFKVLDRLTLTEFLGVQTDVMARGPKGQPLAFSFFEFGDEITRVDITSNDLRSVAEAVRASQQQPVKRVTAIYAKNDVPFALSQDWQRFAAPVAEVKVFRDRSAALEWLRKRVAEQHGLQIEL